ncbi:MAG: acyltransferase [Nocardioidaceae bacterium]
MARHEVEAPGAGVVARGREAWPDTLRVVIIAGVIAMHAATGYVVDVGWYYEERTSSEAWQIGLTVPAFLGGLFALGPLFFVAGWLSAPSLARKGPRAFAAGRLLRLGVPLLVFTFLIDPVADYAGHRARGGRESLLDYLANRTGARDTGPLWFVAVILLFSLGYAVWRHWRPVTGEPAEPRARDLVAAVGVIALVSFVVWQWSSLADDSCYNLKWAQWPQGGVLFLVGIWAGERPWLDTWLPRRAGRLGWTVLGALVVLLGLAGLGLASDDVEVIAGSANLATFAFAWCDGTIAVAGGLWLVAALRRRHPRSSWWRAAAARSSYATYVIHPLVLVALMLLLRDWAAAPEAKFLVVAPLGVVLAYAVGYVLTRLPGVRRLL